jgi:alcohol dehydrogenase
MIEKMEAVVYTAPNEMTFFPEYKSTQQDRDDDVLLKIESVGICGSDMHAFHGKDPRRNPGLILGHEFCGEIVEGAHKGQKVTGNPLITCGKCEYCLQGRDNLCSDRDMIGMSRQGAFAQYMTIPNQCLVHAVNLAKESSFKPINECNVLVIGAGAIGLLAALLLKSEGVKMTVLETNEARHQCVKEHVGVIPVNPINQSVSEDSYDVVIDCVGSEKTNALSIASVSAGGTVVNVGLLSWSSSIDIRKITLQEIKLIGCYTYNMEDFKSALNSIEKGAFGDLSWVEEMPLSETNLAFQSLHNGTMASAKVILKPSF